MCVWVWGGKKHHVAAAVYHLVIRSPRLDKHLSPETSAVAARGDRIDRGDPGASWDQTEARTRRQEAVRHSIPCRPSPAPRYSCFPRLSLLSPRLGFSPSIPARLRFLFPGFLSQCSPTQIRPPSQCSRSPESPTQSSPTQTAVAHRLAKRHVPVTRG